VNALAQNRTTMKLTRLEVYQQGENFRIHHECEHCHATGSTTGFAPQEFHKLVMPFMHCAACGKNRGGNQPDYQPEE